MQALEIAGVLVDLLACQVEHQVLLASDQVVLAFSLLEEAGWNQNQGILVEVLTPLEELLDEGSLALRADFLVLQSEVLLEGVTIQVDAQVDQEDHLEVEDQMEDAFLP